MVSATYKSLFWGCVVAFCFLSSSALADPAKDEKKVADTNKKESPAEIFARAELAFRRQDVKESVDLLREAAWENYTPAQVMLGEYLDTAEYDDEAVGWFLTAAYQGNPAGAFALGKMYSVGEGVAKSDEKALFWIRFAAEKNHLAAVTVMGSVYKKGLMGQKIDLEQAKIWDDKRPALEAAEQKEIARKMQIGKNAAAAAKEAREADIAEKKKRFIEAKALEEAAAKKAADDAAAAGEVGQGQAK